MPRPRKPRNLRLIQGTTRADDDAGDTTTLPLAQGVPEPPDWLPNIHAVKEWRRLAPILHANKLLTDASLSTLAMLCAVHGMLVAAFAEGFLPQASTLAQFRMLSNDLCIPPSCASKVPPQTPKRVNRFVRFQRPQE
ncbi:MAG: hypothetical protein OJF55_002845 [Rhodanobacteraceae bacterium]|nr:MAG: hypothetical protein OJF55_002845 [Rhodanobacteraceae bacterium]